VQLVEIRDLDGPNLFLLEPTIKVELALGAADDSPAGRASLADRLQSTAANAQAPVSEQLKNAVAEIHRGAGLVPPAVRWKELETPGHVALAFGWHHRRFALGVAQILAAAACNTGSIVKSDIKELAGLLDASDRDDKPIMVPNDDRTMPIISITGTNGKTTTTRLITHVLRQAGKRVGWSSSSGVFIDGEQVMDGDYTGPSGALRVLRDPNVEIAVLETARGGILLRGIAYESNDVSVLTNISADHIDLQGIRTLEGLAETKSTVIRITKQDGFAVLNADDPLVAAQASQTKANVFFVSQNPLNENVLDHLKSGGHALTVDDGYVFLWRGSERHVLMAVDEIPIAFGGSARHMLENALCSAGACLGFGLDADQVRAGIASFTSTPDDNLGRLNLYEVDGSTIVVDFAHNEAGLRHLLDLAAGLKPQGGTLTAIIGTAGDRTDSTLRAIGKIAAESADRVIVKETTKYLRGRSSNAEMNERYISGIQEGGKSEWVVASSELDALKLAIKEKASGDVIAIMCVEQVQSVRDYLLSVGNLSPLGTTKPV
jgi:cyanophycin synthetase